MNAIMTTFRAIGQARMFVRFKDLISALARQPMGGLMIETVVAVSLMTVVGTAVLSGLSTTHISGAHTERQSVAENIARNQMASIFAATYETNGDSYPAVTLPASQSSYSVTADSEEVDTLNPNACIQKVIVTVSFEGQAVMNLESIKSDTSGGC